jgi:16S rRNA (uracil1498-N3)-methyltransferase
MADRGGTIRCYAAAEGWGKTAIRLAADEQHHLVRVMRARRGETVTVFDGRGREVAARVEETPERRGVMLRPLAEPSFEPRGIRIVLAQALPKAARMDWIVEKATELGAAEILPVLSERVVTRLRGSQAEERAARWQRIAIAAAEQCGAKWAPEVKAVGSFADALKSCRGADLFLLGALTPDAAPVAQTLEKARAAATRSVALLVGPEGDFTPDETAAAVAAGAVAVRFGPRVLRVETAALYGLSVLAYELANA